MKNKNYESKRSLGFTWDAPQGGWNFIKYLASQEYDEKLKIYTDAKMKSAERLEMKLENKILQQRTKLAGLEKSKPGFRFWRKFEWKNTLDAMQKRLINLERRLSNVKKIKSKMHGEYLRELAVKKLRRKEKKLSKQRDEYIREKCSEISQKKHTQSQEQECSRNLTLDIGFTK